MTATPDWDALNWTRASEDPNEECFEVAPGEGDVIHIRQSDAPREVVTTTREKWRAFVLGVRNDEFDHFVDPTKPAPTATGRPATGLDGPGGSTPA